MDVVFYDSPGKRAVTQLVQAALEEGTRRHGDPMVPYWRDPISGATNIGGAGAVVILGISNEARDIVAECRALAKPFVIVDKGYTRRKSRGDIEHNAYWRVSVNALHPEFSLDSVSSAEGRWRMLSIEPEKIRRDSAGYVLLIAPALRVFTFLGLGDLSALHLFFEQVAARLSLLTSKALRFRGKLDAKMSLTKEGWQFALGRGSHTKKENTIAQDIAGASLIVSHTTNAGVRAVVAGVPVVELGCGVVRPLAETNPDKVNNPRRYTENERERFLRWLAWQQWTLAELASGEAWAHLRPQIL